jgi:hypothetical protein
MVTSNLMELVVRALPLKLWQGIVEWAKTALGQMATGEFWLKLFETIVKQMVNAFMITLGGKLLTYGVDREDPAVKRTANIYGGQQVATAAASAFNGSAVRQDYSSQYAPRATPDYRSQTVPIRSSLDKSFPEPFAGFGGTR